VEPKIVKVEQAEFVFVTDLHLSALAPGRRVDDYEEALFVKLKAVQDWAHRRGAICLCGGDVFHIKSPLSKGNSNLMINRAIDLFGGFPSGKVYGIVGNHDIQFDRHDTLDQQPLGILVHAGVYDILQDSVIFKDVNGLQVEVVGFHYEEEMALLQRILGTPSRPEGVDYRIGIAHAMARPGGAQSHFGHPIIGYDLLEDVDFDCILWGHDHSFVEDTEVGKCLHVHPGSLARAALSSDETDREVHAVGLKFRDAEEWGLLKKKLPVTPLEIAFRTQDREILKADESTEVQGFVRDMGQRLGTIATVDALAVLEDLTKDDKQLQELVKDLCDF
jgi:DNA repair exonuclease SbcCD nuclease subunit